ncbi:hypothetical protein PMIN01_04616 [Paraphaeosphaeria minitans]|uniref:Uncharacterized protein n=1 Tax=Paraphaeosphaeria minitans TaxID=565426 RepID=A0A9P6KS24_9PLEO|nr:hypothetical protein PMIN01_04616 [Paraphaeosphaeria minitans]
MSFYMWYTLDNGGMQQTDRCVPTRKVASSTATAKISRNAVRFSTFNSTPEPTHPSYLFIDGRFREGGNMKRAASLGGTLLSTPSTPSSAFALIRSAPPCTRAQLKSLVQYGRCGENVIRWYLNEIAVGEEWMDRCFGRCLAAGWMSTSAPSGVVKTTRATGNWYGAEFLSSQGIYYLPTSSFTRSIPARVLFRR